MKKIIYCHAQDKGILIPAEKRHAMQPQGRAILKQIVEGREAAKANPDI